MSNEEIADLKRLQEERNKAVVKIEALLSTLGVRIGDVLTVTYDNGTSNTAVFNGWHETETGSKYLKLGTASVPPAYILSTEKKS